MASDTVVPGEWEAVLRTLRDRGSGTVYVVGAADRGKTTFCRWLTAQLAATALSGFLDCDIGQSTLGPPATVGLALYRGALDSPRATFFRFVGAVTPSGHMVQELVGALRLKERAREEGAPFLVVDSPGWVVEPAAQEFHVRMIDLLQPDLVVGFERGPELEGILVNFRRHPRIRIIEYAAPPQVVERKRDWRRLYRFQRFSEYFADAVPQARFLSGLGVHGRMPESFREESWRDLLIALCDTEMMVVALGLVDKLDLVSGTLTFRAPPHDVHRVATVHVGSLQVDLTNPPGRAVQGSRPHAARQSTLSDGPDPALQAPVSPASGARGGRGRSVPDQYG
ncbi:MAG: Polyribonucleotide 5'-hydroxyl-kinase [Methanoregulaceae archaeon PtaU1.Bin059]|nr:MAG: Polyribonucleotide 5'-hydroxyl-kinase [Methanoregulaceae archaeon PtaB.Bin009]OPY36778.1 MAG: Polyribonucleotide 5'-hydroxyl-kinase [Methanoregulaceae archaeon PtaU1.Bin059]